jgi:CheY-like chemotaxis protein
MATILIAEDEPLIRMTLSDALADEGHTVLECANVLEAIATLGMAQEIEAVVTDVDMPGGLNGLDLADLVSRTRPNVYVWIVSGREIGPDALPSRAMFLPKPYNATALARHITASVGSADHSSDVFKAVG